ncbi:hypothetical protein Rhopal_002174-T1 [Rhodotorula paludigena]|uniref:Proteophosphoglycan 5 n=1 Tax=Rhodotorula paludigena TaxID=86838 RepID=A0AAV5G9Z8_9BASI|nr:hypothetical protein Rhopal_002174-T1 [Rhodotorula paludigena]
MRGLASLLPVSRPAYDRVASSLSDATFVRGSSALPPPPAVGRSDSVGSDDTLLGEDDDETEGYLRKEGAHSPFGRWDPPRAPERTLPLKAIVFVALAFFGGLSLGWWKRGEELLTAHGADGGETELSANLEADVREGLWSQWGNNASSRVGTKHVDVDSHLPVCNRTILFDWTTFPWGLGSTMVTVMQVARLAKMHDYELVFPRESNKYGSYYDFFEPHRPSHCRITEDLRDNATYTGGQPGTDDLTMMLLRTPIQVIDVSPNRVLATYSVVMPINVFTRDTTFDRDNDLLDLPTLDSTKPIPSNWVVPPLFRDIFTQWSALTAEHLMFNSHVQAKLERRLKETGIDKPRDRPLVGGNVTHHCDIAYDSLSSVDGDYPDFDRKMSKARLLLMTTEPTALDMFKADPFCARHFDIEPLPQGGTGRPFLQMDFWQLSREDRVEDAVRMLVQAELLANYADTTVVSSNSNTGRSLIFLRGGPARAIEQHRIRSVDIYWHQYRLHRFEVVSTVFASHLLPVGVLGEMRTRLDSVDSSLDAAELDTLLIGRETDGWGTSPTLAASSALRRYGKRGRSLMSTHTTLGRIAASAAAVAAGAALAIAFVALFSPARLPTLHARARSQPVQFDQRIFVRDGGFGNEGLGSVIQRFKESIILAEAFNSTLVITRMHSEHGYSTSGLLNTPAVLDAAAKVDLTRTCSLQDVLWGDDRKEVVREYCQHSWRQVVRERALEQLNNCSVILDAERWELNENLNGCIHGFLRERLGAVSESPFDPKRVSVGIHVRWGDSSGEFRGSMHIDNINKLLADLQQRFGGDNLAITIAMENHDDAVLAQIRAPKYTLVDSGDGLADMFTLANNNVLLLGGSSYAVMTHLLGPRGLSIVEEDDGQIKYENTTAYGRQTVKIQEYKPDVLAKLPEIVKS